MISGARPRFAELTAGENVYRLHAGISSIVDLEDRCEKYLQEILTDLGSDDLRVSTLRSMIWAFTRRHHPEIDIDRAGAILDVAGLPAALSAVTEALAHVFHECESAKVDWRAERRASCLDAPEAG